MVERTCSRCLQSLPTSDFSVTETRCRACKRELNRESYRDGTSQTRSYDGVYAANLLRTFGMTLGEYDAMLARQGGLCAVCREPESVLRRNGQPYRLAVDHNHTTMQVRALLCRRCNQVVWAIEEHAGLLADVTRYLAAFSAPSNGGRTD